MNKEKTFEWTDALIVEYSQRLQSYFNKGFSIDLALREFKKEKLKEEAKRTVVSFTEDNNFIRFYLNKGYVEAISKERLAEILIAESKGDLIIMKLEEKVKPTLYEIFDKDFLQFGEDCFNSARHTEKKIGEFSIYEEYKYKSFSDFMNSQKPKRTLKQIIGSYINSK